MGNVGMKLKTTEALTNQMHLHCNKDENYWMADACDELNGRVKLMGFAASNRRHVIRASGLELFLEIVQLWEDDEIVIKPAFKALLGIIQEPGAIEHLLEMGGREVIDKTLNHFKDDPTIKADGTKIMYALLGKGAAVAMKDVKRVTKQIQYTVPLGVAQTIMIEDKKVRPETRAHTKSVHAHQDTQTHSYGLTKEKRRTASVVAPGQRREYTGSPS